MTIAGYIDNSWLITRATLAVPVHKRDGRRAPLKQCTGRPRRCTGTFPPRPRFAARRGLVVARPGFEPGHHDLQLPRSRYSGTASFLRSAGHAFSEATWRRRLTILYGIVVRRVLTHSYGPRIPKRAPGCWQTRLPHQAPTSGRTPARNPAISERGGGDGDGEAYERWSGACDNRTGCLYSPRSQEDVVSESVGSKKHLERHSPGDSARFLEGQPLGFRAPFASAAVEHLALRVQVFDEGGTCRSRMLPSSPSRNSMRVPDSSLTIRIVWPSSFWYSSSAGSSARLPNGFWFTRL